MSTQTPPSRKRNRNRHDDAYAAASLFPAAAATVSPFADRLAGTTIRPRDDAFAPSSLFRLEPVREETAPAGGVNEFNLSQASISSSVTFGSDGSAPSSESSARMDYWSCSGTDGFHSDGDCGANGHAVAGNMVGGIVESVVGCSVGGGLSSMSSESYAAGGMGCHYFEGHEWLPSAKRARHCGPQKMTPPSIDEDMAPFPKKMGVNCINFKMNIDKSNGRPCCHVCSTEDINTKDGSIAAAACAYSHPGHAAADGFVASAPRSHSLLTYFRPAAKKQAPDSSKLQAHIFNNHHSQHVTSPSNCVVPSNLSSCRYCDKRTCNTCMRQCEHCHHRFCSFCTKVDYDSSVVERILCFECDEYVMNNGDDGDCEMMEL
mmetsp:Transcript_43753/g.93037  ORF Transcript_43753/g.93037 Transcript_43753/m.93037 type:complete len:375 (-) Transcript_43753:153-1277(-)